MEVVVPLLEEKTASKQTRARGGVDVVGRSPSIKLPGYEKSPADSGGAGRMPRDDAGISLKSIRFFLLQ